MTLADTAHGPIWGAYIVVAVLAVISAALLSGRGSWLIAGYNTASKREKEQYDETKLCRVVGGGLAVITLLLLVLLLWEDVLPAAFGWVFGGVVLLVCAAIGILGNTICKKK